MHLQCFMLINLTNITQFFSKIALWVPACIVWPYYACRYTMCCFSDDLFFCLVCTVAWYLVKEKRLTSTFQLDHTADYSPHINFFFM